MTNEQDMTLVLKDQAGAYYLLPQALLEQCRVPAEHTGELERLIAEQQDTQGYAKAIEGPGGPRWTIGAQVAEVFYRLGWSVPATIHLL